MQFRGDDSKAIQDCYATEKSPRTRFRNRLQLHSCCTKIHTFFDFYQLRGREVAVRPVVRRSQSSNSIANLTLRPLSYSFPGLAYVRPRPASAARSFDCATLGRMWMHQTIWSFTVLSFLTDVKGCEALNTPQSSVRVVVFDLTLDLPGDFASAGGQNVTTSLNTATTGITGVRV